MEEVGSTAPSLIVVLGRAPLAAPSLTEEGKQEEEEQQEQAQEQQRATERYALSVPLGVLPPLADALNTPDDGHSRRRQQWAATRERLGARNMLENSPLN